MIMQQLLSLVLFSGTCLALPSRSLSKREAGSILDVSMNDLLSLREQVSGRLYNGIPISQSCFTNYQNGRSMSTVTTDADTCGEVRDNWNNGTFISSSFGGYMTPDFSTCIVADQGCIMAQDATTTLASSNATCHQGSVPNYYIDAQNVSDIQAGIQFAREHQIPLVVKNTGHDYSGRSSGANSLALWTHNYRSPIRLDQNFVPEGCSNSSGAGISVSAGHQFEEVHSFAHQNGYTIISGVSPTVGASGGWTLGGGHSSLSPKLGLGVDNVLQLTAVLPNGTLVTANRCQNQEMFFALRGGGGNAFGILVETTHVAHKEFPVQSIKMSFNYAEKNETVALLTANAEQWNRDGWGVYIDVLNNGLDMDGTIPFMSLDEAKASLKPLVDFGFTQQNLQVEFQSFPDYWSYTQSPTAKTRGNTAIGNSFVVSSRLVPQSLFQNKTSLATLNDVISAQEFFITTVGPANFEVAEEDQPGGPGASAVTPAWRDALWFIMLRAQWDSGSSSDTQLSTVISNIQKNDKAIQGLRDLTPNGGTYFNEAHPYEPNEGQSFWGDDNYNRLVQIKGKIDPENILSCWQCVGFDKDDARFGCYPKI